MLLNLKKLREEKGISQKQLGDIVSVSQQSINKYENHNIEPDIETLIKMADYFQTSVDYIIGYSDTKRKCEQVKSYDLNSQEADFLHKYRRLNSKQRKSLDFIADNYLEI